MPDAAQAAERGRRRGAAEDAAHALAAAVLAGGERLRRRGG
ncbi:hypothetical protein SRB17_77830 [Streptomyces sp. RB17]|nr:hypothetical protein [Streptomyces sp. RB17]MQY39756.1 hypothetical protein [Streptomyces sp. RB17]